MKIETFNKCQSKIDEMTDLDQQKFGINQLFDKIVKDNFGIIPAMPNMWPGRPIRHTLEGLLTIEDVNALRNKALQKLSEEQQRLERDFELI